MKLKILGIVILGVALFLGFVSTRESKFLYERGGIILATPEVIFPYLSQFKLGSQWSPYEKGIEMPKSFFGNEGEVGSGMDFGPSDAGSGRLEILELIPNQMVKLKLKMTEPIAAENIIIYKLTPEGNGTRFSWTMQGDGGFIGKLMGVIIDCEKMVAGQFETGINNLKQVIEKPGN